MYANPTAILSYVMAVRMNGDAPLSAAVILMTTVFSAFTLTIGVYVLSVWGLLTI
jgi:predicted permease